MKRSEKLSEFLNFICQVKPEYDYYLDVQADAEAKILDLLHEIELVPHNAFDMVKIYKQLRESRKQRRLKRTIRYSFGRLAELVKATSS